jgi:hypothetical protein
MSAIDVPSMREIAERDRPRLARVGILLAVCLAAACDSGVIVDDFGPPSGYARIDGRLLRMNGTPEPEGMEVVLTRCGFPIGGLAGSSETGSGGSFSVIGALSPVDPFPAGSDSLGVECELIAGAGFAESGIIEVYFFRRSRDPTVLRLDLHEGAP